MNFKTLRCMYSPLQLALKYFRHYAAAKSRKGHGIHSPFVYDFVTRVVNDNRQFYCYTTIERIREELKHDDSIIDVEDFGAGAAGKKMLKRKVSAIAKTSLERRKIARLLFRMINYYHTDIIIELGTSLGVTAAYLASASEEKKIITLEGAVEVANIAQNNFDKLKLKNIEIIRGDFNDTLSAVLNRFSVIDFAYVDGNHRKEPTIHYFHQLLGKINNQSILVFDDIHWSAEMEEAWQYIQSHEAVTISIDLFFIGIVFFRKENKEKENFRIRF